MKLNTLMCFALLIVSACAKQPDQIAAAEIGTGGYERFNCRQLATQKTEITQKLANLSASQKNVANGDAWGVFLLGLPISSMSGNDKETAIAVAKGHVQAIERMQEQKSCRG